MPLRPYHLPPSPRPTSELERPGQRIATASSSAPPHTPEPKCTLRPILRRVKSIPCGRCDSRRLSTVPMARPRATIERRPWTLLSVGLDALARVVLVQLRGRSRRLGRTLAGSSLRSRRKRPRFRAAAELRTAWHRGCNSPHRAAIRSGVTPRIRRASRGFNRPPLRSRPVEDRPLPACFFPPLRPPADR